MQIPKGTIRPQWLTNNTPPKNLTSEHYCLWNDVKWYWCAPITGGKCQGHWHRHSPLECKGMAKGAGVHTGPVHGNKSKAKASQAAITNLPLTTKPDIKCQACGIKKMRMTQDVNGVHNEEDKIPHLPYSTQ